MNLVEILSRAQSVIDRLPEPQRAKAVKLLPELISLLPYLLSAFGKLGSEGHPAEPGPVDPKQPVVPAIPPDLAEPPAGPLVESNPLPDSITLEVVTAVDRFGNELSSEQRFNMLHPAGRKDNFPWGGKIWFTATPREQGRAHRAADTERDGLLWKPVWGVGDDQGGGLSVFASAPGEQAVEGKAAAEVGERYWRIGAGYNLMLHPTADGVEYHVRVRLPLSNGQTLEDSLSFRTS